MFQIHPPQRTRERFGKQCEVSYSSYYFFAFLNAKYHKKAYRDYGTILLVPTIWWVLYFIGEQHLHTFFSGIDLHAQQKQFQRNCQKFLGRTEAIRPTLNFVATTVGAFWLGNVSREIFPHLKFSGNTLLGKNLLNVIQSYQDFMAYFHTML